jgi:hypothetical protein
VGRGYVASKTIFIPDAERSEFREGDVDLTKELLIEKWAGGVASFFGSDANFDANGGR